MPRAGIRPLEDAEEHALDARQHGSKGHHDKVLQDARVQKRLGLGKGRLEIERDHDVRFRVLRLMGQFGDRVERIEIHDRAAGLQDRVVIDDEGGAIRKEQPDARSLADAQRLQALRRAVHLVRQLRIGHGLAEKVGRGPCAEAGRRIVEQGRQGLGRELLEPVHIRGVGLQPLVGRRRPVYRRFAVVLSLKRAFHRVQPLRL